MSAWIQHIKAFAAKNNLSYGCALSNPECSRSYRASKEKKVGLQESIPSVNPKNISMKGIEIKKPYVAPAPPVKASKKVFADPNLMGMIEGFKPKLSADELNKVEDVFSEFRYYQNNFYRLGNLNLNKKRAAELQKVDDEATDVKEEWQEYIMNMYGISGNWFDNVEASYRGYFTDNIIDADDDEKYDKEEFDDKIPGDIYSELADLNEILEKILKHRISYYKPKPKPKVAPKAAAKPAAKPKAAAAAAAKPAPDKNWKNIGKNTFLGKKLDRYGNKWIWDEDNQDAPLIGVLKPKANAGFDKTFELTNPNDFNSLSENEKRYYNQLEGVIKKYVDTRNKKLDKDKAFGEWAK